MTHKQVLAILCIVTVLFSMCADEEVKETKKSEGVTLKEIMGNPSAYEGKRVFIKGVCSFSYQGLSPCGKTISDKMRLGMGEPLNAGLGLDIADKTNVHMCIFKSDIPAPYPVMTDIEAEIKTVDGYPYLTNIIKKAVRQPYD